MLSKPPPLPRSEASLAADPDEVLVDAAELEEFAETDEVENWDEGSSFDFSGLLRSFGSCGVSALFHLVTLLVLAFVTVSTPSNARRAIVEAAFGPAVEDPPIEYELPTEFQTDSERSMAVLGATSLSGIAGAPSGLASPPELDQRVMTQSAADDSFGDLQIDDPLANAPSFAELVEALPEGGFKGDARAIIDNYEQAMDRLAQELMWMMERGPVLVVWLFDQSGSMKDDQQEIRQRIYQVYAQLGLVDRTSSDWLLTSIASFGEGYLQHTPRPTSDIAEIRAAIQAVPEDPSGEENMCSAIIRAIEDHQRIAQARRCQIAMVLVTDESGEQENNRDYLEVAIQRARDANCRVYVLGRESAFGYPYVYSRWQHPETDRIHWLQLNRGPESGFVEQLQVDGFRRRHDAFPSGFGPFEQCRLARETGGIFFMLPSLESSLVRGEKRHYELDLMRPYRPDLRARGEVLADRDRFPLRSVIWQCIYELDPYQQPQLASEIEMRIHFAPEYNEFVRQAQKEIAKAQNYLTYLARVQHVLEVGQEYRRNEADPRWQANYDLIYAQLIAYQARIWEYGAALEAFVKEPKVVPLVRPPDQRLMHWNVVVRKPTRTSESLPYIERAETLFQQVIDNHPGTPWAARAAGELTRGFGVDFQPEYHRPYRVPPNGVTVPIPKL